MAGQATPTSIIKFRDIRIIFKPVDFLRIMYLKDWKEISWFPNGCYRFSEINPMMPLSSPIGLRETVGSSDACDTFNDQYVYSCKKNAVGEFNSSVSSYVNMRGFVTKCFKTIWDDLIPDDDMPSGYPNGPLKHTLQVLGIISQPIPIEAKE